MKIQIDYDGSTAKCLITEFHGHPDMFVNFNNADEYSQIYAMGAFQNIIKQWEREHKKESSNE